MGCLPCSRTGCENILCGYYSYDFGYLCLDCRNELKRAIGMDIFEFMKTPPNKTKLPFNVDDWEDFIDNEFPWRE